jgi:hypothetical protein
VLTSQVLLLTLISSPMQEESKKGNNDKDISYAIPYITRIVDAVFFGSQQHGIIQFLSDADCKEAFNEKVDKVILEIDNEGRKYTPVVANQALTVRACEQSCFMYVPYTTPLNLRSDRSKLELE